MITSIECRVGTNEKLPTIQNGSFYTLRDSEGNRFVIMVYEGEFQRFDEIESVNPARAEKIEIKSKIERKFKTESATFVFHQKLDFLKDICAKGDCVFLENHTFIKASPDIHKKMYQLTLAAKAIEKDLIYHYIEGAVCFENFVKIPKQKIDDNLYNYIDKSKVNKDSVSSTDNYVYGSLTDSEEFDRLKSAGVDIAWLTRAEDTAFVAPKHPLWPSYLRKFDDAFFTPNMRPGVTVSYTIGLIDTAKFPDEKVKETFAPLTPTSIRRVADKLSTKYSFFLLQLASPKRPVLMRLLATCFALSESQGFCPSVTPVLEREPSRATPRTVYRHVSNTIVGGLSFQLARAVTTEELFVDLIRGIPVFRATVSKNCLCVDLLDESKQDELEEHVKEYM